VRRAKRAVQAIFVLFAAVFIVLSTVQVERQVFGIGPSQPGDPNCSFALRSFEESVDRGLAHAALEHSRGKADEVFEDNVSTQIEAVHKHCKDGRDHEAYLAATRYRDAAEAAVEGQQVNLANLRRALDARLP